jgi:hypothetical protein
MFRIFIEKKNVTVNNILLLKHALPVYFIRRSKLTREKTSENIKMKKIIIICLKIQEQVLIVFYLNIMYCYFSIHYFWYIIIARKLKCFDL